MIYIFISFFIIILLFIFINMYIHKESFHGGGGGHGGGGHGGGGYGRGGYGGYGRGSYSRGYGGGYGGYSRRGYGGYSLGNNYGYDSGFTYNTNDYIQPIYVQQPVIIEKVPVYIKEKKDKDEEN